MGMPPRTGKTSPPSGERSAGAPPDDGDQLLDEALDESFPASDPVAIHIDTAEGDPRAKSTPPRKK